MKTHLQALYTLYYIMDTAVSREDDVGRYHVLLKKFHSIPGSKQLLHSVNFLGDSTRKTYPKCPAAALPNFKTYLTLKEPQLTETESLGDDQEGSRVTPYPTIINKVSPFSRLRYSIN